MGYLLFYLFILFFFYIGLRVSAQLEQTHFKRSLDTCRLLAAMVGVTSLSDLSQTDSSVS